MLFSSMGPLAIKWSYVPKMIPWILKFIKNCTKKKMMHTAKYMHQILDLALPAYDELFEEIVERTSEAIKKPKPIHVVQQKKAV